MCEVGIKEVGLRWLLKQASETNMGNIFPSRLSAAAPHCTHCIPYLRDKRAYVFCVIPNYLLSIMMRVAFCYLGHCLTVMFSYSVDSDIFSLCFKITSINAELLYIHALPS